MVTIMVLSIMAISQFAAATPYEFSFTNDNDAWIDTSGPGVASNGWFFLAFPDDGANENYTGTEGIFEYDDVADQLVELSITLMGKDDNSSERSTFISASTRDTATQCGSHRIMSAQAHSK